MTEELKTVPFTHAGFTSFLKAGKLMATRCTACGHQSIPPRAICPECHSAAMEWVELSGEAQLLAFTSVYIVGSQMEALGYGRDKPNISGVVEMESGLRITALIRDVSEADVQIGMALKFAPIISPDDESEPVLAFSPA